MQKALKDIHAMLPGSWIFERNISGLPPISGEASFNPAGQDLHYREELKLPVKAGKALNAHREYLYSFDSDTLSLYFVSGGQRGGLFMPLEFTPSSTTACGSHLCVKDLYTGTFKFNVPDSFSVNYLIKGPDKDYEIKSNYKRRI